MSEKALLIQRRGRVKGTITRIKSFSENIAESLTHDEIAVRLDRLKEAWDEFCEVEDSLLVIEGQVSEMDEYETKYFQARATLLSALRERRQPVDLNQTENLNVTLSQYFQQQQSFFETLDRTNESSSNAKLPRLNIPFFSGDYKEWSAFQDLYMTSVHNKTSISPSIKFQYLKGLLKGNAASLIRHLTISDANYTEAWTKLKERFDKKSHIVTAFIKTFLEQPQISQVNPKTLRNMCDLSDEVVRGLRALGPNAEMRDPWLIHIALTKLDSETRELWAKEIAETDFPTLEIFFKFLNKRCDALETCAALTKRPSIAAKALHAVSEADPKTCLRCNGDHLLIYCKDFKSDTPQLRRSFTMSKILCFKCLRRGHSVKNCHSKVRCSHCKGNHHPLLHMSPEYQKATTNSATIQSESSDIKFPSTTETTLQARPQSSNLGPSINSQHHTLSSTTINTTSSSFNPISSTQQSPPISTLNTSVQEQGETNFTKHTQTLLPTAVANIYDINGVLQPCRILLDSGSQVSLISEPCAQRLALKRENARMHIHGLSATKAGVTRGKVQLRIVSRLNASKGMNVAAFVMSKLSSLIPFEKLSPSNWNSVSKLPLADPHFNEPFEIDVLLGSDHFFDILQSGQQRDKEGRVIAQETIFGWIPLGPGHSVSTNHALTCLASSPCDIDKLLTKFWEIEEPFTLANNMTDEEQLCESFFKTTLQRESTGRFIVSLPFKNDDQVLGESLQNALRRFYNMERRFAKDTIFKTQYVHFMKEYEELGHMELIRPENIIVEPESSFYLPHHAVFKKGAVAKIRVVFDGSCKTDSGVSLNDKLMVGPIVQRDLISILLNFRKYNVAFTADIEKMYRQVLVAPEHRDFQRIVWRDNVSDPVRHYRLKTVTYGTASAPFLATRALKQISEENLRKFPEACSVIQNDFYVDDLLSGADSLDDTLKLKNELIQLLQNAGFHLTKWHSNSPIALKCQFSDEDLGSVSIDDNSQITKILGIQWDPQLDAFTYRLSLSNESQYSKRTILSNVSKIFDPLGWLAPAIVVIKVMLQQLWQLKLDWDDPLPEHVIQSWKVFKEEIPVIQNIYIPRHISSTATNTQWHGFSDASERAYGAVWYCRSTDGEGNITVRIVAAKTKVAPVKQISVPRLELCGALLLTKLFKKIVEALHISPTEVYAWTDSSIVLSWLADIPRRWNTFVGNRTSEILETISREKWNHVASKHNPADLASRGLPPNELVSSKIWWNGPDWLSKDSVEWPTSQYDCPNSEIIKEKRKQTLIALSARADHNDDFKIWASQYSSFSKFLRILAYCRHFVENCKQTKEKRNSLPLSVQEMNCALTVCIQNIQSSSFSEELKQLRQNKTVSSKSNLSQLNAFMDDNEIIRVGGRIRNSKYNFNARHPVILPKKHPVSIMLIQEMHRIHLHPGPTLLMGLIRQRFWIIGMRSIVTNICRKCVVCVRHRAAKSTQLMGDLPAYRITVSRPFSKVGIDYAGPLMLTSKTGRGARQFKGYIALFICLSTKAIHLELVSGLDAEAFVATLRRFISRRGIPSHIFSDNGTNFVGGRRLIRENQDRAMLSANNVLTHSFLSQNQIAWQFIPPGAPNFGGLWEAGVKSVKWHLRRVIGEKILSFEEMATLLCQIEALLNSRPYSALSSDPSDLDALTPGHFLVGAPPTTLPEPSLETTNVSHLGRWQQVQAMVQGFWRRWRLEYLTSLQQRFKWKQPQENLQRNDLVLIREDNLPPSKWLLGRIIECHPGPDQLVRVVTIKTQRGTFQRSLNKIVKLPIC